MADFQPTPAQKAAIEARGGAVLVSAGAGSGKTKVLTERLMKYILDEKNPAGISSFVIITFTKAAAAELKGRITAELSHAASGENISPEKRAYLRRQQAQCAQAQIGTIHSFCASVLRENGHVLAIPPDFRILSDERALAIRERTLEKLLNERYEKMRDYPGYEELVNSVGVGRDDKVLADLVLQLYDKMQCHAHPGKWAQERLNELRGEPGDIEETLWGKEVLFHASSTAAYWAGELDRMTEAVRDDPSLSKIFLSSLTETAAGVRELERRAIMGWDAVREAHDVSFPTLGRVIGYESELKDKIQNRRKACKTAMEKLRKLFYADSETLKAEMRCTTSAMEALLQLTLDFEKRFIAEKRKVSGLDYSDLEHEAARLLIGEDGQPTEIAGTIASRYTEIMVDEYQDVSLVQDAIFRAVSRREKNLFMVGDVKQAIYRFRLADPEIFNNKYTSYKVHGTEEAGEASKIFLRENFRSGREILDAANAVFSRCMSSALGEVEYDENASLIFGAKGREEPQPIPELDLFALPQDEDSDTDKNAFEAACVARKIRQLVAEGTVTENGERRSVQYGDIAILLRSANKVGKVYCRELMARGIPAVMEQGGDFFREREISFLTAMLRIMDNPTRDVALIEVLSSPVFSFSADELAEIRSCSRGGSFWDALRLYAEDHPKANDFLQKLNAFRSVTPDKDAEQIIRMLVTETDILPVCSAMPDGRRRIGNILQMIRIAQRFEKDGTYGLHRFVLWLEKLEKKNTEQSVPVNAGSAVRILTVHKSKGLEFPVVFLCDTARWFNKTDAKAAVLVHPVLGLGPKRVDAEQHTTSPTLARKAIALRMDRETLSEEMRLLYVALTRARDRLFITAVEKDPYKFVENKRSLLSFSGGKFEAEAIASALSPADWLTMAALADEGEHLALHIETGTPDEEAYAEPLENKKAAASRLLPVLEKNLSFVYPYAGAEQLPSKVTATELKHMENAEDSEAAELVKPGKEKQIFLKPDFFRENKPAAGAERGIATHLALQYMNPEKTDSESGVREEIERLREKRYLSERQAEAVNTAAIAELFRSPLGQRIRAADRVWREFRFSILCNAGELLHTDSEEEILLQGVVDCCIEENGELVVIDYKTDNVHSEAQIEQRRSLYESQVKAYTMALTRIFSMPVKESVLYFLSCGRSVTLR